MTKILKSAALATLAVSAEAFNAPNPNYVPPAKNGANVKIVQQNSWGKSYKNTIQMKGGVDPSGWLGGNVQNHDGSLDTSGQRSTVSDFLLGIDSTKGTTAPKKFSAPKSEIQGADYEYGSANGVNFAGNSDEYKGQAPDASGLGTAPQKSFIGKSSRNWNNG